MKVEKSLKKLRKKMKKEAPSVALKQLRSLKNNQILASQVNSVEERTPLTNELRGLAGQVALSAAQELAQPLNPLLSWFSDAGGGHIDFSSPTPVAQSAKVKVSQATLTPMQHQSIISLPLRSPPCKRCPALQNGICKCAAKRFRSQ